MTRIDEIIKKLDAIDSKVSKADSAFDKFLKVFEKLLIPISVIILTIFTQKAAEKISLAQMEASKQQFTNGLQTKYLEIFYSDITGSDSIKRISSISLLSLMNDSLADKLKKWVISNPTISNQIKQKLIKQESNKLHNAVSSNQKIKPSELMTDTTSFFNRIEADDITSVKLFLNSGFPLDVKNEEGETPLMIATKKGNYEIFQLLVSKGANKNLKGNQGRDLLHIVVWGDGLVYNNGHITILKWLLRNGFAVNSAEDDGGNALMTAVYVASSKKENNIGLSIVKILLDAGSDPCIRNNVGNNSFSVGATSEIEALLKAVKSSCN